MNTLHGRLREAERDCSNLNSQVHEANKKIESLRQQLAECKATNGMLREAVSALLSRFSNKQHDQNTQPRTFGCNHMSETCFACEGLVSGWKTIKLGKQALALLNDAAALNDLIAERTASLAEEIEKLKDYWSAECAQVDTLRQQNAELTVQINNLKAQISHLEYQCRP